MMSYYMLVIAALELAIFLWAFANWRQQRDNIPLLFITIMLSLQWVDALIFGIGRWLGQGDTLETLNRLRNTWFFFTSPLLLMASVFLLKNANFAWFQSKLVLALIVIISIGYMAVDGYAMLNADYYPACAADTLRYVLRVAPEQMCVGVDYPEVEGYFSLMLIASTAAVMLSGLALWIWRSWPWLAIVSILFLFGFVLMPTDIAGPFLSFPLDGLMSATIVLTALKFAPASRL